MKSEGSRQAVWRWHFIAGLITLPFMLWLAATGSIYLFETEIETTLHRPLLVVEAQASPRDPAALILAAETAGGGMAQTYVAPEAAHRSAEVVVAPEAGESRSVFVNPYSGHVLGELDADWRVTYLVRQLHGLALLGPVANGLIEAAAGWILILSLTGVYLWWPRSGRGAAMSVRGSPALRLFWRDLHSVIGVTVATFAIFLALTGLLWSGVWGEAVHEGLRRIGHGVPDAMWGAQPTSGEDGAHAGHGPSGEHLSWTVQGLPGRSGTPGETESLTLVQAASLIEAQGLRYQYTLTAPTSPDGVFVASHAPDKAADIRVIQLDRFSGAVLNDFTFEDFGAGSKALEWGVSVHMGKEYGRFTQWLMFTACLGIIGLGATAIVSWLKRRRRGEVGTPRVSSAGDLRVVTAIILGTGILFPLTGITAVVIAAGDWLIRRRSVGKGPGAA